MSKRKPFSLPAYDKPTRAEAAVTWRLLRSAWVRIGDEFGVVFENRQGYEKVLLESGEVFDNNPSFKRVRLSSVPSVVQTMFRRHVAMGRIWLS